MGNCATAPPKGAKMAEIKANSQVAGEGIVALVNKYREENQAEKLSWDADLHELLIQFLNS